MVFWMIRVRFVKNRRLELAPGTSPV
jgi:hypothetical protein